MSHKIGMKLDAVKPKFFNFFCGSLLVRTIWIYGSERNNSSFIIIYGGGKLIYVFLLTGICRNVKHEAFVNSVFIH